MGYVNGPAKQLEYSRVEIKNGEVKINNGDAVISDLNRGKLRVTILACCQY